MGGAIERALRGVREKLLENPVSPRVETPADINTHYCRYVAQTVVDRVDDDVDVRIVEDGGRGYAPPGWFTAAVIMTPSASTASTTTATCRSSSAIRRPPSTSSRATST